MTIQNGSLTVSFQAGSTPGPHRGRRRCRLILVSNAAANSDADFFKIAHCIRAYDSKIKVSVITNRKRGLVQLLTALTAPTLIVSLVPLARFRPLRGRFLCGQNLSKSEEYSRLEAAGIAVSQWQIIREGEKPDLSGYGPYVVTKPNRGSRGALVKIKRAERVRHQNDAGQNEKHQGRQAASVASGAQMLAQQFIYTSEWPISYRVTTLFGKVLLADKSQADQTRKALSGPNDFGAGSVNGIVASGKGCIKTLNFDEEIIRFGESAAAAFPEIPLLGFDIVREIPSGKLFVLEANAVGYVWHFSSPMGLSIQRDNSFNYESQFDGLKKAAHILADTTQKLAR